MGGQWHTWWHGVRKISTITFPRFIFNSVSSAKSNYKVHVVTDGSPQAYNAAFYLHTLDYNAKVEPTGSKNQGPTDQRKNTP